MPKTKNILLGCNESFINKIKDNILIGGSYKDQIITCIKNLKDFHNTRIIIELKEIFDERSFNIINKYYKKNNNCNLIYYSIKLVEAYDAEPITI